MKIEHINNFFGDMDLYLIDAILKGVVPDTGSVLDLGCGAGRNAVYFLNQGFKYTGVDSDASQVELCRFVAKNFENVTAFHISTLQELDLAEKFDFIICSQVLHFAEGEDDFFKMWSCIDRHLEKGGIAYITLDTIIDTTLGQRLDDGRIEFPDGKVRFALTESYFKALKEGFEEVEPLRSVIYHGYRAQSFMLLQKVEV